MYQANAPDLVKRWKAIVNDNVMMGRDAALIKKQLVEGLTSAQILYGIYQYEGERTITIPQFLAQQEDWLIEPAADAEIELACCISHTTPPEYYIWKDLKNEQTSYAYQQAREAHRKVQIWAQRVLA